MKKSRMRGSDGRASDATADYISVKEAGSLLRLSEVSIRRYLTKKILGRYKVGSGRTLLRRDEVLALIKQA